MISTRHVVLALCVVVATTGCKKNKTDPATGSGSDVASGSGLAGSSGSAPATPDAAAAVVTPPPAAIDAAPAGAADAAGAATAPSEPAAYTALPAPPQDCEAEKCVALAGGQPPSSPERAAFFKQGCATGDAESCARLASTFDEGLGVPANLKAAVYLYDRACTMKVLSSCQALGALLMYGKGRPPDGIEADTERAIAVLDGACKAQHWAACTMLGDYYISNGQRDTALPLYRVACDHQDKRACDALKKGN